MLTVETFLPHLAPFANKDVLTPGEASRVLLIITEAVLDHRVDLPLLKFLSRFLTQESYDEIVEERNIEHQCGYMTCQQSPVHKTRRLSLFGGDTKFQIYNRKPSIILPNTFLSQYCCKDHYQASLFYRNQLSSEALFARKDIMMVPPFPVGAGGWYENKIACLEEVLAKHRELRSEGKSLSDVITMMSGLLVSEDPETGELVRMIEDFEIVEKEGGVEENPEEEVDSGAIEGYITTSTSFGGYVV